MAPAVAALPDSSIIAAYSVAASGIVARAILPAGLGCPSITVTDPDGKVRSVPMKPRPRPERTDPAFEPLAVCSATMPVEAVSASIGGRDIPSRMPHRIERLAMLGDSGCRIDVWQVQDCSDPSAWPLARVSAAVASDDPEPSCSTGTSSIGRQPVPR